jgi:transposase-like protein
LRESVKEKKVQKRYDEEFKRQAVELVKFSQWQKSRHGSPGNWVSANIT